MLKPYIPNAYSVNSTNEFINLFKTFSNENEIMASLDIVSLFTNVPVDQTIQIILDYVYRHKTLKPLPIPESHLKEILIICTTKTPFVSPDNKMYI